jgi:uncharacterized membrane protein
MTKSSRILLIILSAVVIILAAAIVYVWVMPAPGERFTEFYVLDSEGNAAAYPREAVAGRPVTVTLGLVNHEGADRMYRIQTIAGGAIINGIETGNVKNGQKWENKVNFRLDSAGDNQAVAFYLYLDGGTAPHIKDPLVLRLNVTQPK